MIGETTNWYKRIDVSPIFFQTTPPGLKFSDLFKYSFDGCRSLSIIGANRLPMRDQINIPMPADQMSVASEKLARHPFNSVSFCSLPYFSSNSDTEATTLQLIGLNHSCEQ